MLIKPVDVHWPQINFQPCPEHDSGETIARFDSGGMLDFPVGMAWLGKRIPDFRVILIDKQ